MYKVGTQIIMDPSWRPKWQRHWLDANSGGTDQHPWRAERKPHVRDDAIKRVICRKVLGLNRCQSGQLTSVVDIIKVRRKNDCPQALDGRRLKRGEGYNRRPGSLVSVSKKKIQT